MAPINAINRLGRWSYLPAVFCLVALPCAAQVMNFSVYTVGTLSSDGSTIFNSVTVQDNSSGCTHSGYITSANISSPDGRYAPSGGWSGMVANTNIATNSVFGNYALSGSISYYCSCFRNIAGAGGGIIGAFGLATSYMQSPTKVWNGCYYGSTACFSGTSATCGAGWVLNPFQGSSCSPFIKAQFLTWQFLGARYCSIGAAGPWPGPGPCT